MQFDQHFMENDEILDLIISSSEIKKTDEIIEIGPGPGYLTTKILEKQPKKLFSIEVDPRFQRDLDSIKGMHYGNFSYEIGNALEIIEWKPYHKLVANIPYSITEPLYTKLIEHDIAFAVLLQGKKFYDHITGSSIWNRFVNAFYDVEVIREVSGDEFEPKTKVTSIILKLTKKHQRTKLEEFCYQLFLKRKRSCANALTFAFVDGLNITKKEAKELVEMLELEYPELVLEQQSQQRLAEILDNCENLIEK